MSTKQRALELLRRVYGEVVKGRTRVRVVEHTEESSNYPARFILSPYRSGTTLLRYCLDSHPEIAVPPETDFLFPMTEVLEDRESLVGVADLGYSREDFARALGRFGRKMHDVYATGKGASAWIDKSPRYATIPERLKEIYPEAIFIVLARNPLDQVHSFTRGGSFVHEALGLRDVAGAHEVITAAAGYWSNTMRGLHEFAQANSDSVLTITYERLCEAPESTLREVLAHVGLGWSPEVLEYHKFDHDKGREAGRVAGTIGFSASSGGWKSWDPDTVAEVCRVVSGTAALYGYDLSRA